MKPRSRSVRGKAASRPLKAVEGTFPPSGLKPHGGKVCLLWPVELRVFGLIRKTRKTPASEFLDDLDLSDKRRF